MEVTLKDGTVIDTETIRDSVNMKAIMDDVQSQIDRLNSELESIKSGSRKNGANISQTQFEQRKKIVTYLRRVVQRLQQDIKVARDNERQLAINDRHRAKHERAARFEYLFVQVAQAELDADTFNRIKAIAQLIQARGETL